MHLKKMKISYSGLACLLVIAQSIAPSFCNAQENYEIQVYGSETIAKGNTMAELHSNFTFDGRKETIDGVLPTNHVFHETIEITHGWTSWFETGLYIFNAIGNDRRTSYVGSHIRPRVKIPKDWNWPVGVSLSVEAGFQKATYSEEEWSLEIRPIVDKQFNKWYFSFNPTFEKSLYTLNKKEGFVFAPNAKASYNFTTIIAAGLEYYGALGTLFRDMPYQTQQHQIFIAADLDWSPDWELNFGYGWGFTQSTDNAIVKVILGYRFH
ncbi:MAG: hypothetical protein ABI683_00480 [Ginsengibacter sp.]